MTTRHIHADMIHAWAEGQTIQVLRNGSWADISNPVWGEGWSYRIKPKVITLKYRRYVTRDTVDSTPGVFCWQYDMRNKYDPSTKSGFVRWIDSVWQQVDIEN